MTADFLQYAIATLRARRCRVEHLIIRIGRHVGHITDTDLERHYLGMIPTGPELEELENHLLICGKCVDRAEETARYVDAIRAGAISGDLDLLDP